MWHQRWVKVQMLPTESRKQPGVSSRYHLSVSVQLQSELSTSKIISGTVKYFGFFFSSFSFFTEFKWINPYHLLCSLLVLFFHAVAPKWKSLVVKCACDTLIFRSLCSTLHMCSLLIMNLFSKSHDRCRPWNLTKTIFCWLCSTDFSKQPHLSYYFGYCLWQIIGFSFWALFLETSLS